MANSGSLAPSQLILSQISNPGLISQFLHLTKCDYFVERKIHEFFMYTSNQILLIQFTEEANKLFFQVKSAEIMVFDRINIILLVLAIFIALIALAVLYQCQFSRNKSLSVVILVIICVILLFAYFVNQYQNCCYWRKSSEKN